MKVKYAISVLGVIESPTFETREQCSKWNKGKNWGGWRALIVPVTEPEDAETPERK